MPVAVGGIIAIAGSVSATVLGNRNALRLSREERASALELSREERASALALAREERESALALAREERIDNRRKDAYLELTKAVTDTLLPIGQAFRDGLAVPYADTETLVLVRGFALLASPDVRRLYYQFTNQFSRFTKDTGSDYSERRRQFGRLEEAAYAFEAQIHRELSPDAEEEHAADE